MRDSSTVRLLRLVTFTKHEDIEMCFFHKWSKWERYETTSLSYFYSIPCKQEKVMQRRECEKCGFTQDEWIANKKFVSLTKENIPNE